MCDSLQFISRIGIWAGDTILLCTIPMLDQSLVRLLVPEEYHACLLPIATQEDLLDCPGIPQEVGQPAPHILYTTYTNALVRSFDQQLKELLGEDSACVKVMTADMIVWNILSIAERKLNVARDSTLIGAIERALQQLQSESSAHLKALERLNRDYLLEEICQVIIARKITTFPCLDARYSYRTITNISIPGNSQKQ